MEEKIQITSLTGLISQAQLSEVVSALVSCFNGKIEKLASDNTRLVARIEELEKSSATALVSRIERLENENFFIVESDETDNNTENS